MSWFKKLFKKSEGGTTTQDAPGACDHGQIELRQGTAEFEWFVAKTELESGNNLSHGATHLGSLLSFDPGNKEWMELLESYIHAVPDAESLIPRGDQLYYTTEAMRAYIWYKEGRMLDAVNLLANVVNAKTDAQYLEEWALPWLEPPGSVESLNEGTALLLFSVLLNRFPECNYSPHRQVQFLRRWAQLIERYVAAHPEVTHDAVLMLRAGLLRKAGMFDRAEELVRKELKLNPNWHSATALGLILRQKGDPDAAEEAFEHALQLDPQDISAKLEAGDTFFECEQWKRALDWYENVLKKEPRHEWALPSAHFCRWMMDDQKTHINSLISLARQGNHRAQNLANQAFHQGLPEPVDASTNILRQMREEILKEGKDSYTGEIKMAVTSMEAPSNYLAFNMEMESLGADLQLSVTCSDVPSPDPREPIAEIKYKIWNYIGTEPDPGLPAPPPDVVERIATLAAKKYDPMANWAAASKVAAALDPSRAGDLLAVMVHPPKMPKAWHALAWLPRVQLTVAQVVAHLDEGWDGSVRKEALLSVLFGPQDWATEAAIRAMATLGRENEWLSPHVHEAFQHLAKHRPSPGYCCWEYTLYNSWLVLPHLFPHERDEIEAILREMESENQSDGG